MGKILINSCDFDDLLTVPGIGHDFALQIISLRESKGQITDRSFALFRFSMDPAIVDHASYISILSHVMPRITNYHRSKLLRILLLSILVLHVNPIVS